MATQTERQQLQKVTINAVDDFFDSLRQFETLMNEKNREHLRELVLILPDPYHDMNRCNTALRLLFEVLSAWNLPTRGEYAGRPYVDLEIFVEDNSGGRGNVFVSLEAARPFIIAPDVWSLRPGPYPFAKVHVVKTLLFGRGRRLIKVDAWRAQMCPYLADGLVQVNRDTFLVGDYAEQLPVNTWLHDWFARRGVNSRI